jgi:hypothetical protein
MEGGVWANFAVVGNSQYEFTIDFVRLDFARQGDGKLPGTIVSRVNLSPLFVSQLLGALETQWQAYVAQAMPKEMFGDSDDSQP